MEDFIIPSVVGALIGYSTNWLAIKMLFRPHNEIRIFGTRLPFTPGLIPKERLSIAKKVGDTVGRHLMTTDVLVGAVYTDETAKNFNKLMDGLLERLRDTHKTFGSAFVELTGWSEEKFRQKTELIAEALASSVVKNEKIRWELNLSLTERILVLLKNDGLVSILNALRENVSDKKLSQYISESDLEFIKKIIRDKTPGIMNNIRDYISYDVNFGVKLRAIVHKVIDENVGGFTGLFINKDKVFVSIEDGLENYLSDPESQTALIEIMLAQLDRILDMECSDLLEKLPEDLLYRTSAKISELDGLDNKVDELVSKILDSVLNDSLEDIISGIIKKLLNTASDMEINALIARIEERNLFDIKKYASRLFDFLIKKCSYYVFDSMNFNAIIENQLNSFGVAEVEDIIMSIVKRELSLITYLGGIIGFFLGLLSALL